MAWSIEFYVVILVTVSMKIFCLGLQVPTAAQQACNTGCTPKFYDADKRTYVRACHVYSFNSHNCSVDITEYLNFNANKETRLIFGFTCKTALHLSFSTSISTQNRNVRTSLYIDGPCTIFFHQSICVVAQVVMLTAVTLFDGTQLIVPQMPNDNADIKFIELFVILIQQPQYNDVISLFTSIIWPRMIFFQMRYVPLNNAIVNRLKYTMPLLQILSLRSANLVEPPDFPWSKPMSFADWSKTDYYNEVQFPKNTCMRLLYLKYNNIHEITTFQFRGPLQELSLRGNGLRVIRGSPFKNLAALLVLDLGNNKLDYLPGNIFTELTSLAYLHLDHNNLSEFHPYLFKDLIQLERLYLNNNNISRIKRGLLSFLRNLVILHVENNQIQFVDNNMLPEELPNLREIYLQNNTMKYISSWTLVLQSLEVLDMSYNRITTSSLFQAINSTHTKYILGLFNNATLYYVDYSEWKFREFNLSGNYINTLNIMELHNENPLAILFLDVYIIDLSNNPIVCDCIMAESALILEYHINQTGIRSKGQYRSWECATPTKYANINIFSAIADNLECKLTINNCSEFCQCYWRPRDDAVVVDCRNRNLTSMPHVVPNPFDAKLLELHLEGNNISKLLPKPYLQNITYLYLSHNSISVIDPRFFVMLSRIRYLYIDNNHIESLPKAIRNITFEKISLKHNLFQCTCRDLWMKKWLQNITNVVVDVTKIRCISGPGKGKTLTAVPQQEFICRGNKNMKHSVIIQGNTYKTTTYSLGAIFGLLFLASVIIYKFRGEIKALAYARFHLHPFDRFDNHEDNDEIIYDAFVSYSHHDFRWVIEDLKERLETNEPPFKLCIHDRDFLGGSTIQENIFTSVRQSKRMLLILSRNFIRSEWCLFEFRAAHHRVLQGRNGYLIIILLEDIDMELVDDELKLYMRTNTCLRVQRRLFWQSLLYALPQKSITELEAAHIELQGQQDNRP